MLEQDPTHQLIYFGLVVEVSCHMVVYGLVWTARGLHQRA